MPSRVRQSRSSIHARIAAGLALALAACAADGPVEGPQPPEWFTDGAEARADSGYPDLSEVPKAPTVQLDPAHWDALARDLEEARAALRASPRAAAPPPEATEAAEAFSAEADAALGATRERY